MSEQVEKELVEQGAFKGMHGLEGLAKSSEFWEKQEYGTRLYYGSGIDEYLHRGVLQSAVEAIKSIASLRSALEAADGERERMIRAFNAIMYWERQSWIDYPSRLAHIIQECRYGIDDLDSEYQTDVDQLRAENAELKKENERFKRDPHTDCKRQLLTQSKELAELRERVEAAHKLNEHVRNNYAFTGDIHRELRGYLNGGGGRFREGVPELNNGGPILFGPYRPNNEESDG